MLNVKLVKNRLYIRAKRAQDICACERPHRWQAWVLMIICNLNKLPSFVFIIFLIWRHKTAYNKTSLAWWTSCIQVFVKFIKLHAELWFVGISHFIIKFGLSGKFIWILNTIYKYGIWCVIRLNCTIANCKPIRETYKCRCSYSPQLWCYS